MGNIATTTWGAHTLPDPLLSEWEYEIEPEESTKIMLAGNLQKRGTGFRRVFHYVAKCTAAQRDTIETAWRAFWCTPANFSPRGTASDYSCVPRGAPTFRPLDIGQGHFECRMDLVEVTGHTS